MKPPRSLAGVRFRTTVVCALAAGVPALGLLGAGPAAASGGRGSAGAVFAQLNSPSGNEIAAYSRGADGRLAAVDRYPTGGLGGTEVNAPFDALASQSSLTFTEDRHTLLAVNAGSDTVTSFHVHGATLRRASVVASGGRFPSSITTRGDLVYVLNAGGSGSISGFRLHDDQLFPLTNSTRSLGNANANPPLFINAPAQIGLTSDGRFLLLTTKAHNQLLTFAIGKDGRPAATPTATASTGAVPFSFVIDPRGRVHVTEAGTGRTSSYTVTPTGALRALGTSASDGGAALCWNVRIGKTIYGANAGSATLSAWRIQDSGQALLTAPVATTTNAGPIDLAASDDGDFLYVQESVAGTLGAYQVSEVGALTRLQTVTGLPAYAAGGMEGIAAS